MRQGAKNRAKITAKVGWPIRKKYKTKKNSKTNEAVGQQEQEI